MKTKKSFMQLVSLGLLLLLSSFATPYGGEGFQIFVDGKKVLEKFHQDLKRPTNLQLNASRENSVLEVKFYHCGMAGKNRSLILKDADQQLLKQWEFTNEEGKNFAVTILVKELLAFQKRAGAATLYLYYSSREAADGRLLTGLIRSGQPKAAVK
jgi:hypothetical protein